MLKSGKVKVTPAPWATAPDDRILDTAFAANDRDKNGGLDETERLLFRAYVLERGYKLDISIGG